MPKRPCRWDAEEADGCANFNTQCAAYGSMMNIIIKIIIIIIISLIRRVEPTASMIWLTVCYAAAMTSGYITEHGLKRGLSQ